MIFNKHINKYYLRYLGLLLIGLSALLIVDYIQLYIPEVLGKIVDIINGRLDLNINKLILNVVFIAIGLCIGRICFRLTIFYVSNKIQANLRNELFLKAEKLSLKFYHENKVGSIMTLFTSDLETIEEFLGWGSVMLVDASFLSILVVVKMLRLDYMLSLICFVPIILLIIWGLLVERIMTKKWDLRQANFDRLYDYTQENFTGIRVIKAFVKENQEIHYFSKLARKNKDVCVEYAKSSVIFDVLIEVLIAGIMLILLGLGGYFAYSYIKNDAVIILNHTIKMTSGNLVTFIAYFESLVWPMIALGRIVAMRSRAKSSLIRISRFLDAKEDIKNPENAVVLKDVSGKIEFKNFSFRFPDSKLDSVSNISLTINPGELIGVIGKVGSGKSTLFNSLLRFYNLNSDSLFIDDIDIMKCDIKSLRDNISCVLQDNFLFSDKVRNNIAFSNPNYDIDEIEFAAKFSDVDKDIKDLNAGYDTITGERGVSLSGGQKQRVSIARAFIKDSPIMILDDSVSAVDVKTEEMILKNIREYRKSKTTIIIASRVSTVINMDRIIVLNDGKLEAFDRPSNLLEKSETFKKMVYLQTLERELEGEKNE